jgi:hypothetical protein
MFFKPATAHAKMNKKLLILSVFMLLFLGINFAFAQVSSQDAINSTTAITCTDSDGGLDYSVKSNVLIKQLYFHSEVEDACLSDMKILADRYLIYKWVLDDAINAEVINSSQVGNTNILMEAYCPSDGDYGYSVNDYEPFATFWKAYTCPNGCSNGICIQSKEIKCSSNQD